jgi:lipopolysaccharide biosynthesis glycosyltransferase
MEKIAIVFVTNRLYYSKFKETYRQLRENGKYKGEVVLIIGDDLIDKEIEIPEIMIVKFPEIKFSENFYKFLSKVKTDGRNVTKLFQWHKLYLFDSFFKKWDYILYIDCGMKIFNDISPIINSKLENTLLAHSDSYPQYKRKLINQFDISIQPYSNSLIKRFGRGLFIDYFQTGILLFDTKLIGENTLIELINLAEEYPISNTNEQGIVALYFTNIKPKWKQIVLEDENTKYYDFCRRQNPKNKPYIIYKSDLIMK